MILIGLGGNLPSRCGAPRQTLAAALEALAQRGVRTVRRSRWYESAPVPDDGQPWFINAVAHVDTGLGPTALLATLLDVEAAFGRRRDGRNRPRTIDLDLLTYDTVRAEGNPDTGAPVLPHPRLHERAFVLVPLAEVAPGWRHPVSGRSIDAMLADLPPDQRIRPLEDDDAPPSVAAHPSKR